VDVTGNITAKLCEVGSEFNIFGTLVTMTTAAILNLFNPLTAATHYSGYSYKVSWSLMKGIQNCFKSPLLCFHGNCGKVCPTDSDMFGLSRSTSCGCCSYQVSSISVRRVTWQPFWKNQPLPAQLHMAYDIPTRFHKVWSMHLREIERTKMCGIIIIIRRITRIAIAKQ
jgi:hypothetical protein